MSAGQHRPSSRGYARLERELQLSSGSAAAQIQNVKKSRVYVFGDADVCDDEVVEFEMSEVRSRKSPKLLASREMENKMYFDREIFPDDTLQSLSLQYGCPMSEIKRVNNLIRDQEFFALRTIKIPLKKHSFLSEKVQSEKPSSVRPVMSNGATIMESGISDVEDSAESVCDFSDPETQNLLIRTLSIKDVTNSQSKQAKDFLRNMDKDLSELRSAVRTDRNSLDEVISVLTNKSISPLQQYKSGPGGWWTDGANCGLRWKYLVAALILIAVILPLACWLFYYKYMKAS